MLLALFLLQVRQTRLYKAFPMSLYPYMPSSSTEGITLVLSLSIAYDAWFWSSLMFKYQNFFFFLAFKRLSAESVNCWFCSKILGVLQGNF